MNEHTTGSSLVTVSSPHRVTLSSARGPIAIRVATMADLPFLDQMQKMHGRALGYFPTKQFEGYIGMGAVLVAEEARGGSGLRSGLGLGMGVRGGAGEGAGPEPDPNPNRNPQLNPIPNPTRPLTPTRLGYCISKDRYLKRDELGVIYQLCVAPGHQRGLIGATLVREVFIRSAYGCRLYCCWCAQDLAANYFWESLGFVPIAFRAGSTGKRRVHIFWQRRIDRVEEVTECGSDGVTEWGNAHPDTPSPHHSVTPHSAPAPYWYPFQTSSGAIREDRIVFPIPPGTRWQDVKAVVGPRSRDEGGGMRDEANQKKLPAARPESRSSLRPHPSSLPNTPARQEITRRSALRFAPPADLAIPALPALPAPVEAPKRPREKRPAEKIDPSYLQAARELRDRYLERLNESPHALVSCGKYDVTRLPAAARGVAAPSLSLPRHPLLQLPAAA